jgi:hypothetical protein
MRSKSEARSETLMGPCKGAIARAVLWSSFAACIAASTVYDIGRWTTGW